MHSDVRHSQPFGTDTRGRMRGLGYGMRDTGWEMRDAGCGMRDVRCGIRDAWNRDP
jgi:hypothetical protein